MKNFTKLLLLLGVIIHSTIVWGQNVSTYSFSSSSGSYSPIVGGTNLPSTTGSAIDDNSYGNISIGFTFTYGGLNFTAFGINANGWIQLGTATPTSNTSPLTVANNVISAFGVDVIGRQHFVVNRTSGSPTLTVTAGNTANLAVGDVVTGTGVVTGSTVVSVTGTTITLSANASSTGTGSHLRVHPPSAGIRYQTIGSAPNRQLVVQWTSFSRYSTTASSGDKMDFQIILEETTNKIYTSYNIATPSSAASITPQAGLRGAAGTDFNTRSTTTDWSATTAGGSNGATCTFSNTVAPPPGLLFTWTPPAPPSCGTPTTLAAVPSGATSASLSWAAPIAGTPIGYDWEVRTSGAGGSGATGLVTSGSVAAPTTTATATGLAGNVAYNFYVRTDCGGSGTSTWAGPVAFTIIAGDNCGTAVDLATLISPYSGTTVGAAADFSFACNTNTSPDLIFFIDVPNGQQLVIGQTINGYDSEVYVYSGGACPGTTQIACFDDPDIQNITYTNCTGSTQRLYWIQDGYFDATISGTFTLAWTLSPIPVPSCAGTPSPTNAATNAPTNQQLGWATVSGATSYDVYFGTATNPPLVGNVTTLTYNPGTLLGNTTYYWKVVAKNCAGDAVGCTEWTFTTAPPPPANDDCAGATAFATSPTGACSYTSVSSTGALQSTPAPSCTSTANNDDVWFTVTPPSSSTYTLRFQNMLATSGTATQLGYILYTGTCASLTAVTGSCVTAVGSAGSGSTVTPSLTGGTTYYLRVWTTGTSNSATWDMCLELNPPPLSDNICDAPEVIVGGTGVSFATAGATTQSGESTFCTPPSSTNGSNRGNANWNSFSPSLSSTVWAKFVAPASGNVEILAATSGDSQMGLFKGAPSGCPTPSFSGMSHVQSNDDDIASTSAFQSRLRARLNPGETYYVLVDGYNAGTPSGTLTVTELTTVTQNDGIGAIYTASPVQAGNYEVTSEHPSDQGWSYYYYNNGTTTNIADDQVVLSLQKNNNNLGIYSVSATASPTFSTTTFQVWGGLSASGASTLSTAPYVAPGVSWAMMNRYWNVVPQIQPGSSVAVRTYYQDADWTALQTITTGFVPPVPLTNKTDMVWVKFNRNTGHWNNTDLNPTGGHSTLTTSAGTVGVIPSGSWTNTVLASGVNQAEFSVTSFSGGGAGGGTGIQFGPLPIELKSFTGKTLQSTNMLEWVTSTEQNVREHVIERSLDGFSNWSVVGVTPSKGDSRQEQFYNLEDKAPLAKAFYRLRSVDNDGKEQLSGMISLTRLNNTFGVVAAYPNPATESINIDFNSLEEGMVMANITDLTGRLIQQQQMSVEKGVNTMTLPLFNLGAGTYYISLQNEKEVTTPVRFVKQ